MLIDDFERILLLADPKLTQNRGDGKTNYTVWTQGGISREMSDDEGEDLVQRVYVERFTKLDTDPVVKSIWQTLENNYIAFEHEHDYETYTKYHHHTFTCYVQVDF